MAEGFRNGRRLGNGRGGWQKIKDGRRLGMAEGFRNGIRKWQKGLEMAEG